MAKKYTVNSRLSHDGKDFSKGDSIELDDKHATRLLEIDVIGEAGALDSSDSSDQQKYTDLSVSDAIDLLDKDNEDHWTKDGKPDANALSDILNRKVSAKERDAEWEKYQANNG